MVKGKKKHFVLVHGMCFGAWCWYKVVVQLKSEDHKVTAVDLAASGIHPKHAEEVTSLYDYSDPLMEFMEALPPEERIVLVGHSLGGFCIALAMEKFPQKIAVAVFIAAGMPGPDISMQEIMDHLEDEDNKHENSNMDCQNITSIGEDQLPTSTIFDSQFLSTKLCQLSPPDDISLALLFIRPTATSVTEGLEAITLNKENYGTVRRAYFITEKDNVTNSDLQRWMIEKNSPDEVKIMHDSDHMAMFSQPKELCAYLQDICEQYN